MTNGAESLMFLSKNRCKKGEGIEDKECMKLNIHIERNQDYLIFEEIKRVKTEWGLGLSVLGT